MTMRAVNLAILAIAMGWLAVAAAYAQEPDPPACAPADEVLALLNGKYGEQEVRGGYRNSVGSIVQWLDNVERGTWSVIEINPDGTACLLLNGTGLEVTKPGDAAMSPAAFVFTFVTSVGHSTVPGLTERECNWIVLNAPAAVAQSQRSSGRPLVLIEATCKRDYPT